MDSAALAALAGNALVTAAVTDAWETVRQKAAHIFGRGHADGQIERRLDATRQQLSATAPAELERARSVLARQWETRFADLLADYPEAEGELDALVREIHAKLPAAADHSGVAGRDMIARADRGGAAANIVHGNLTAGPTLPGQAHD